MCYFTRKPELVSKILWVTACHRIKWNLTEQCKIYRAGRDIAWVSSMIQSFELLNNLKNITVLALASIFFELSVWSSLGHDMKFLLFTSLMYSFQNVKFYKGYLNWKTSCIMFGARMFFTLKISVLKNCRFLRYTLPKLSLCKSLSYLYLLPLHQLCV